VGTDELEGEGEGITLELDVGTVLLLLWVSAGAEDVERAVLLSDDVAGAEELASDEGDGLEESVGDGDDAGESKEVGTTAESLDEGAGVMLGVGESVGGALVGNCETGEGASSGNERESD